MGVHEKGLFRRKYDKEKGRLCCSSGEKEGRAQEESVREWHKCGVGQSIFSRRDERHTFFR